ncbi:MAG: hypothetical protein QGH60_12435 [Phycisphaerae bacterium]|nr:hypothetical protein [Phycisphaerae bacterium]
MTDLPAESTTRREFIRSLARGAAVGAVAGGGILLARNSVSRGCGEPTPCKSCRLRGQCDLPEARTALNR